MNKTLLLIIVDFLFLNLIALTRWENSEPVRPSRPPVAQVAANAPASSRDQDLVATMRDALADEQTNREDLARKLSSADAAIASREQSLSAAQAEREKLASRLDATQAAAAQLGEQVAAAHQEQTLTKDEIAQLERELDEKNAEAERQKHAYAALEAQDANARKEIEGLTMAVVVDENEKQHLQQQAAQLQTQVQTERTERLKVQATTAQLAQGVGQLAQNSGELTKEIRDNRPININVLFSDFLANRVYALVHIDETTFSFGPDAYDWSKIGIRFDKPPFYHTEGSQLEFLGVDPRVVVLPVEASQVAALGVKVYPLALNPFRFADAVLISGGGKGYGEVGFKLDADRPGYVRVDNRFFKRLFGDFAPSTGDLVFSHAGELLGIMVNNDYCALIKDFSPARSIRTGDSTASEQTGQILDDLGSRIKSMPDDLQ